MEKWDRPDPYAPCRCGSGRKYKLCCLAKDRDSARRREFVPLAGGGAAAGDREGTVSLDLDAAEALNESGLRAMQAGDFTTAERHLRAAIHRAPTVPAGHNNLALALFGHGRVDDAMRVQEGILKRCPDLNPFGWGNLVVFYLAVGQDGDAAAALDRALETPPTSAFAVGKVCEALARLRRHQGILDYVADNPQVQALQRRMDLLGSVRNLFSNLPRPPRRGGRKRR